MCAGEKPGGGEEELDYSPVAETLTEQSIENTTIRVCHEYFMQYLSKKQRDNPYPIKIAPARVLCNINFAQKNLLPEQTRS